MSHRMKNCITLIIIMTSLYSIGESLMCFECDNLVNPACGVEFKSYQYQAHKCHAAHAKCGLQRQPQIGEFIGIIRRCHILGSVANLNETDGCHSYIGALNRTFEICLCSDNYCNSAANVTLSGILLCACLALALIFRRWCWI